MLSRSSTILILCLCLVAVVYAENYTWGMRQHNDRLLNRTFSKASSKMFRVVTLDVHFPNKTVSVVNCLQVMRFVINYLSIFQAPAQRNTINQIVVTDQMPKKKGGYAALTRGGIGFNHTSLHLKSQRGEGLDFIVDIYGV